MLKTPLLISSSCILNPLTLRELASAICIVRFLQRQLLFVKDNTATSLSFRPAMSSSVSNRIAEICVNVANTLKDQIIHKRADICVSCPICEAILLKLSADDLGPADVNDSTLENQETLQCKTCSIDIDICCFTLLPYVPCNLDTDAVPAVYPLKCTACRALCNSGRMQHWMPEHCRVEYSWLPQSSGANCFCMFCSVPLMPANC